MTQLWGEETGGDESLSDMTEPQGSGAEAELVRRSGREENEYDEFEELPNEADPDLAEASTFTAPAREEALGDLSLEALTERLAQAIAANMRQTEPGQPAEVGGDDPVVTFLHREADRAASERTESAEDEDPQTVLRSALDRLSKVGRQT